MVTWRQQNTWRVLQCLDDRWAVVTVRVCATPETGSTTATKGVSSYKRSCDSSTPTRYRRRECADATVIGFVG